MTSRKLILSAALLLLGGCGGEDNSSQTSNNIMAPLAGDAFEVLSKDDEQTTVSLKGAAIDPQGLPLTLESVVPTNQECDAPTSIDAQALTFTVDNAEPELCFYRYSVKNHPAQASQSKVSEANSYVLKSASAGSLLPPLSETTQVDKPITINIAPVTDYALDSDVVVLGDGSTVVDSVASTITYTPNAQGVTRLVYTMTSDDGTEMVTGTIDVAVSDVGNTAPDVAPIELLTQPGSGDYFNINESYPIDLSGDVSDTDGDDVQLIQVEAWNANVALAAPDDPTNLSFTFQTSSPGAHYVTYVVSDHRGGYGVEQVRIEAYDLSSVATWSDIQKGAKLFSAPLTQSEALISEVPFTSSHVDSNGSTVTTFNFDQAQALCASKGHLPTSANLTELVSFEGGPAAKGWPVDIAFWANDGGTPALINLASGAPETESASGHYVTCLNEGGFTIDAATSDFEAVANGAEKATIAVKLTFDGAPVEGQLIEASTSSTNVAFDATSGTTNSNGLMSFAMSSFVAEEVPIDITYSGETLTQNVTFIADEATADLSLVATRDGAADSAPDGNEVEATMTDINTNPLVGRTVTFDSPSSSVVITPAPGGTDASGKQTASVVWNGGLLTSDTTVNVTARFTPASTGTEITDTAAVTFTSSIPAICDGIVDSTTPVNDTTNCLKVATNASGAWFTSTPSIAVMNALGYKGPGEDSTANSETNTGDTYAASVDVAEGKFVQFRQDGAIATNPPSGDGSNGQLDRWCQKLTELEFGGKSYWRRPSIGELKALHSKHGNLRDNLGWPSVSIYWTKTVPSGASNYNYVNLYDGSAGGNAPSDARAASCIAPPPPPTICGTGVDDAEPTNATGNCLKVATDAAGAWFTSSPSIAVMGALGYDDDNTNANTGDTYATVLSEDGTYGPNGGEFARFRQDGATTSSGGTNGQFDRWCQKLSTLGFGGENSWRRPTQNELELFYDKYKGNSTGVWGARGWPTNNFYLTSTSNDGSGYVGVVLHDGSEGSSISPDRGRYASCIAPLLPVCGTGVDDTDKTNATGSCLKVATDAAGNWFTSAPSIAVMNKLNYTKDSSTSNSGDTYGNTYTEDGSMGPSGTFATFTQNGAGVSAPTTGDDGTNGQFNRWCQKLNALEFGGKTNWRRPTSSELTAFYQKYEDEGATTGLWEARGWPAENYYWGSDIKSYSNYYVVKLANGYNSSGNTWGNSSYASCVSP